MDDLKSFLPQILERLPYLRVLVLFGSRARGDNNLNSDWDLAVLYDQKLRQTYEQGGWDFVRGWVIFEQILQLPENKVDFVILNECSDLLAHVIARDGKLLYEQEPGEFEAFRKKSLKTDFELKQIEQQEKDFLELELQKW
ncbi:nucleotidyltransferase domain-containing protein [Oculatella sp. LEGE 06141]|nr:nucleotidyltransferase domain-containing protein [Oculatella sp. LEGE 06141]